MGEKDTASVFHTVCVFVGSFSIVAFFCQCLMWSVGWNTVYVDCFDPKDWVQLRWNKVKWTQKSGLASIIWG